jgi:hypothetical protein
MSTDRHCAYCKCKLHAKNKGVVCGCLKCSHAFAELRWCFGTKAKLTEVVPEYWHYERSRHWEFRGMLRRHCGRLRYVELNGQDMRVRA